MSRIRTDIDRIRIRIQYQPLREKPDPYPWFILDRIRILDSIRQYIFTLHNQQVVLETDVVVENPTYGRAAKVAQSERRREQTFEFIFWGFRKMEMSSLNDLFPITMILT